MIRATIRRLRRLYERLWKADSLGFLHAEATFLRDANARRTIEIQWSLDAHWLAEPGAWNRFRRFKYVGR